MSGDWRYQSLDHREAVNEKRAHFSISFFFNPSHTVMTKPLAELVSDEDTPKYSKYNWGRKDFRWNRSSNENAIRKARLMLAQGLSTFEKCKLIEPEYLDVYMAPEYAMQGQLSVKAEVYSFGVLLLEIVRGRKNMDFDLLAEMQILLGWDALSTRGPPSTPVVRRPFPPSREGTGSK
eukprot:Gb_38116 [translate_table: standard]